MKRFIFSLIASCSLLSASAQDITAAAFEHSNVATDFASALFKNPANQLGRWSRSLREVTFNYDGRQASQAANLEDGTAHNIFSIDSHEYHITKKATIWGKINYSNGLIKNQLYNETCDTWLLYPYLMADTVGGNTRAEQYHFMGGFCHDLGKWHIAGEGKYTAHLTYRNVDPRPKNLSSNLHLKLGVSMKTANYEPGIAVSAQRYKQTNEIQFYNEVSTPIVYHLTGLGNDYYRFRGMNTDTYYDGWGSSGIITLRGPISATAEIGHIHLRKVISSLNQLPMATTATTSQAFQIAYVKGAWGVKLDQTYFNRRGTENIFGSAQSNIYPLIASAQQYRHKEFEAKATAMWQLASTSSRLNIQLAAGWQSRNESYMQPSSQMKTNFLSTHFALNYCLLRGKVSLCFNATLGLYNPLGNNILAVSQHSFGAGATSAFTTPVTARYDYLSNNHYDASALAEATYQLSKKIALVLRASWSFEHYAKTEHCHNELISAGIRF